MSLKKVDINFTKGKPLRLCKRQDSDENDIEKVKKKRTINNKRRLTKFKSTESNRLVSKFATGIAKKLSN